MKTAAKIAITALITSVVLTPNLAFSKENGMRIHDRLIRQQQRIEHGIDNGTLNRKEAKKLKREQRKIRKLVRTFRSDGRLSRAERNKIKKKLDVAGDRIWKLKHNDWAHKSRRQDSYAYQEPRYNNHSRNHHSADISRRYYWY